MVRRQLRTRWSILASVLTAMSRLFRALLGLLLLAGCAAGSNPASPSASLPVGTGLVAVSKSQPSAEAAAAMEFCGVRDEPEKIAGMALVTPARDAYLYVPVVEGQHELQTDKPAWIIALRGEFPQFRPVGESWIDPVCIVVESGSSGFIQTGPGRLRDGTVVTAPPLSNPPTEALPTLAP
jgi:hypothetical protein